MNKFTFKMKDRMKLVIERPAANSCVLIVSGKKDIRFSFSKKRAAELISCLQGTITYGIEKDFTFRKTLKSPAGKIVLTHPTTLVDSYTLAVTEDMKSNKFLEVFNETDIPKKQIKKMIKVMKEVYGI